MVNCNITKWCYYEFNVDPWSLFFLYGNLNNFKTRQTTSMVQSALLECGRSCVRLSLGRVKPKAIKFVFAGSFTSACSVKEYEQGMFGSESG
jgi:hypothetical protein